MSGYTLSGATNRQLRPTADERAKQVSKDIAFRADFLASRDGDWSTVEGLDAMRQAIYHRLITCPGEYKARPNYGVGVQEYVKEEKTDAKVDELKSRIKTQLLEDRRIQAVEVSVEVLEAALKVHVGVRVNGQALTFLPYMFTAER